MIEHLTDILIDAGDRNRLDALEIEWRATLRRPGEFAPITVAVVGHPVGDKLSYKVAEDFVRYLEARRFPVTRT
jgi:hypothetical protein